MSDSVKKYHEMVEDGEIPNPSDIRPPHECYTPVKFIWVLDFEDGKVFRYDIDSLNNTGWSNDQWDPDHEECEAFLIGAGHKLTNIEWMVTSAETFAAIPKRYFK